MAERRESNITLRNGFLATQDLFVEGTVIDGNDVYYRGMGRWEISKGFSVSIGSSGGSVNPLLNVSNTHAGLTGGGSIAQAFAANVYLFAGSGTAYVGGVSKGAAGSSVTNYTGTAAGRAGPITPR